MNDQQLWKTLKDVHKTLKRWEKVKKHLPQAIITETNEALLTELSEAVDNLDTQVNDALSQEIRAGFYDGPSRIQEISKSIHDVAHHFIMANQMDLAKEILESEVKLSALHVEEKDKERKKAEIVNMSQITAEQVKVMAKLVELGEEDAAKELGQQLLANINKEPVTAKMINDGKTLATFIETTLKDFAGPLKSLKSDDTSDTTLASLESSLSAIQNGIEEYRKYLKKQKKSDYVDLSDMGQKRAFYEKKLNNKKVSYSY